MWERVTYQKHLGIILDEKLNFKQHVDHGILKINKGVIKKLCHSLPRKSLITIYKGFLRPLITEISSMTSPKMNLFVKRLNLYNIKLL